MTMTSNDAWVGGALRRVANAVQIAERHRGRSDDVDAVTHAGIEQTIEQALSYGFSVEAVAEAAGMDVASVEALAASESTV